MGLQCSLFPIMGDAHIFLVEKGGARPLLAQSGQSDRARLCPLLEQQRTSTSVSLD